MNMPLAPMVWIPFRPGPDEVTEDADGGEHPRADVVAMSSPVLMQEAHT